MVRFAVAAASGAAVAAGPSASSPLAILGHRMQASSVLGFSEIVCSSTAAVVAVVIGTGPG